MTPRLCPEQHSLHGQGAASNNYTRFSGPGLTLDAVVQSDVDKGLLSGSEESIKTVNLMPEYLVVCCWRSIKEVSLLLGQLTCTAPLVKDYAMERDKDGGLLSVRQVVRFLYS